LEVWDIHVRKKRVEGCCYNENAHGANVLNPSLLFQQHHQKPPAVILKVLEHTSTIWFLDVAKVVDYVIAAYALEDGTIDNHCKDYLGFTAMLPCAMNGNEKMMPMQVAQGARLYDVSGKQGGGFLF